MAELNIRISQLDRYNSGSANNQDFFPLVHSASMTTFRATLQDVGAMFTHSLLSDFATSASFASTTPSPVSASHAKFADTASLASGATSASHAIFADSASFVLSASFARSASNAGFATSSSYAGFVVSASYAATSSVAKSSSYAVTASYAPTSSYATTASYSPTSSFAFTASFINSTSFLPAGLVMQYAANSPPTGWLECNGSLILRAGQYAALFAAIGETWGAGDGVTTFKLPDARGMFLRGWDNGAGVDTGRAFASSQTDAVKNHTHVGSTQYVTPVERGTPDTSVFAPVDHGDGSQTLVNVGGVAAPNNGATENRPKNIALMVIIKY